MINDVKGNEPGGDFSVGLGEIIRTGGPAGHGYD